LVSHGSKSKKLTTLRIRLTTLDRRVVINETM
jgi:hypothetical protein